MMMTRAIAPGRNIYSLAIEGATDLAIETGAVPGLAEVADAIGVPTTRLRILFPQDADLVAAMVENAMLLLHHTFVTVVSQARTPDEQLLALAQAYIEWGYRYPREFRIIGSMPAAQFEANPQLVRYEHAIHDVMMKILIRAREMSMIPPEADLGAVVSIAHTYAYGVVSKMLLGDLARWNPGRTDVEVARDNLKIFIRQFLRPAAWTSGAVAAAG